MAFYYLGRISQNNQRRQDTNAVGRSLLTHPTKERRTLHKSKPYDMDKRPSNYGQSNQHKGQKEDFQRSQNIPPNERNLQWATKGNDHAYVWSQ